MKNFNDNILVLSDEMKEELSILRLKKNFCARKYVELKVFLLDKYFKDNDIKNAIIGISGGIDSCVSLGILKEVQKLGNLKNIYPLLLPARKTDVVTSQEASLRDGILVCNHFNQDYNVIDLRDTMLKVIDSTDITSNKFADGQLIPNLRTAVQYWVSSIFADRDERSVVIGTINRSEGSYIGYMGKAGVSIADIQIISDLWKSEVFMLAHYFKVPDHLIQRVPTGDFDERSDEEVFGVPYDFIELYLLTKDKERTSPLFLEMANRVEKLHNHNKHKYIGGSPSVHLDLYCTYIKGGMRNNSNYQKDYPLNPNKLINFQKCNEDDFLNFSKEPTLSQEEINILLNQIKSWEEVGIDGYLCNFKKGDPIGSYRASIFSEVLSQKLKEKLSFDEFVFQDGSLYRFHSVNPYFRFIKYENGGRLIPHYDFPYASSDTKKTLFSVVLFLKSGVGGVTRFLEETRINHDFKDWINPQENINVIRSVHGKEGEILIFKHNLLHDSTEVKDSCKIIIRTDLFYEKIF